MNIYTGEGHGTNSRPNCRVCLNSRASLRLYGEVGHVVGEVGLDTQRRIEEAAARAQSQPELQPPPGGDDYPMLAEGEAFIEEVLAGDDSVEALMFVHNKAISTISLMALVVSLTSERITKLTGGTK